MKLSTFKLLSVCPLLFLFYSNPFAVTAISQTEIVKYSFPAVIAFGDSILDTGNNNYIETFLKANFKPYGKDFIGAKSTGRFCNGKISSDLFAEKLGVKEALPPYLDSNLKIEDLLTGVSFASAGSGYDPVTVKLTVIVSLPPYSIFLDKKFFLVQSVVTFTSNLAFCIVGETRGNKLQKFAVKMS